mmetsp:Transcript_14419/g.36224  ORF Transcript_14419/g.36224 Transcript_14419/m.36224 type:complete len:218 (+) Transcript_14419:33-686(+)
MLYPCMYIRGKLMSSYDLLVVGIRLSSFEDAGLLFKTCCSIEVSLITVRLEDSLLLGGGWKREWLRLLATRVTGRLINAGHCAWDSVNVVVVFFTLVIAGLGTFNAGHCAWDSVNVVVVFFTLVIAGLATLNFRHCAWDGVKIMMVFFALIVARLFDLDSRDGTGNGLDGRAGLGRNDSILFLHDPVGILVLKRFHDEQGTVRSRQRRESKSCCLLQ